MRIQTLSSFFLLTIVSIALAAHEGNKIKNPTRTNPHSNRHGTGRRTSSNLQGVGGRNPFEIFLRRLAQLLEPAERVSFLLYTQQNPTEPQQLYLDNVESITESYFNASDPTKFTIHGWMSDPEQHVNTFIRDAYLNKGPHNIIVLDWIPVSVNWYEYSVKNVPHIGKKVGQFIDFMAEHGWLKPENLTLIGHSLGAHISGVASRSLKSGQVHSIVALDPAQPGFSYETSKHRLRSTDAYYVESIQTTVGTLGYYEPIGKAAFYPNGGVIQPDCGIDLIKSCAHFRSYVYYAEAIRDGGFPSIKCDSPGDAISFTCGNEFSDTVRMGDPNNADHASGVYLVPVFPNPPYSFANH